MRKHDVRKWLHAVLDLLPVILIPVFMIYSHRHDVTENVEINYKYQSNEVNTLDDLVVGNIYFLNEFAFDNTTFEDLEFNISIISFNNSSVNIPWSIIELDDIFFGNYVNNTNNNFNIVYYDEEGSSQVTLYFTNDNTYTSLYFTDELNDYDIYLENVVFYLNDFLDDFKDICIQLNYLPQYTDYNVIESVDTTNSNVMDSFMNNFNNTIDKHFNMGNVFNLGGVYQWFNTNIFSGNAPTVIYSIWNIALYELVMDLLFLLYGLFMWFIDMIQKLMEKPLNSIK